MVARALLDELTFGAVSRRERPVSSHVPYTRHVDDHIIRTRDGLVLTIFKLEGYPFETSDISEVNARLLGRNDVVRTLANSRFALVSHIVRREVQPRIDSSFNNPFCRELDERYNAALSKRRMFVNDLYLTVVRRPLQGQAGTFELMLGKLLGRTDATGASVTQQTALTELRDVATAVRENLSGYGIRQLGVVARDGVWFSETLEFLVQLLNGGLPRPMHLPRMDLADALAMKRIFFGRNAIELR
ncbi:MAG: VirB4 family type IV secretion system protein, partial [Alphaproteobacteria bacterium]|nr:VirB4 family type IV secretion system protein [Alphaproteobacteria bacterium]